jgi:exodeoxyribonuclease VII small subunit
MAKEITLDGLLAGSVTSEDVTKCSFEVALRLLEEVVTSVEAGNLPLDKSIGSYEKGTLLVKHLRTLLSGAEEKLRVLQQEQ